MNTNRMYVLEVLRNLDDRAKRWEECANVLAASEREAEAWFARHYGDTIALRTTRVVIAD